MSDGNVTLTVQANDQPGQNFVRDPNPSSTVPNLVPEIAVREMESVLQLTSGQTAILGGLMQDDVQRNRDQCPTPETCPASATCSLIGTRTSTKSELVIFIRPIVVKNPSLDSDELKDLRRLLPKVDQTGTTP